MSSMENNLICTLWLYGDSDSLAAKAIKASPYYDPPAKLSTEPDEAGEIADPELQLNTEAKSCRSGSIRVSFSHPPQSSVGFTLGASEACDVSLPIPGIGESHFAITFNTEGKLVIRDLNSTYGTNIVDESGNSRLLRNSEWTFNKQPDKRCFDVSIHPNVWFKLVLAESNFTSPTFAERIQRFREGAKYPARGTVSQSFKAESSTAHGPSRDDKVIEGEFLDEHLEVERAIGKGGSGSVVLATAVTTGRKVVIKAPKDWEALAAEPRGQTRALQAFRREAATMRRLNHPNIVKLYHADFVSSPRLFVEWVPLGCLDDTAHPSFTEKEALQILEQILGALVHMHGQRPSPIVHRDVSPGNILVAERSGEGVQVKLADFGLSREGLIGLVAGTSAYMAPEISNAIFYNEKVDVWSLGVVALGLFCQLPGLEPALQQTRRKFNNKLYAGLIREAFEEAWKEHERLDQVIWSTLNEMLREDANVRWSAARCLESIRVHCQNQGEN